MNLENIKYTIPSTSSLTVGSYIEKTTWDYIKDDSEVLGFPFGNSEKDYFDISVYSMDDVEITGSLIKPSGTYKSFGGSYYNIENKPITYSHEYFVSDLVVVGKETQSVLLDVSKELEKLSISDGNYKIGIQLNRDVVGSSFDDSQRLMIDEISPSRTEISTIPISLRQSGNEKDIQLLTEFESFASGKIIIKQILDQMVSSIKSPEIYSIYYTSKNQNVSAANDFLFYYGFKQNVDAIRFITDVYYGVKKEDRATAGMYNRDILGIYDQFYNILHQNYNTIVSFQDLRDLYYSLFYFIIEKELTAINGYKPASYNDIVKFLSDIYYSLIFLPAISKIETNYNNLLTGYFKNYLNFGDGKLIPVMNTKFVASTDPKFHDRLIIKLSSPLDNSLSAGSKFFIVNTFASPPIIQNTYYFTKKSPKTIPLRGPNFTIKVGSSGNSTETLSSSELINESGSLYQELLLKVNSKLKNDFLDTVDYRYFENFITFSTATLRLDAYEEKISKIKLLETQVSELETKLMVQPNDSFYLKDKLFAENSINEIKYSFDGYENFLYNNPDWHLEHIKLYDSQTSASIYDQANGDSLINNLPEFISSGTGNEDYVRFVGMIGHYFDNISGFIKQITNKNDSSNSPTRGISPSIVSDMLDSLGWESEISKENLPLLLSSLSKSDFSPSSSFYDKVGNISETDRNRIIWRRLLNSLPFIYKTKGTEASVNAIISCFGIPKNLIKIKEYGGIDSLIDSSDKSYYIFDHIKYEPYFSGSGEYFESNWTGSVQTIEFNVSFDENKIEKENSLFYIAGCAGYWNVGAIRDRGKHWGRLFFTIDDGTYSKSMATTKIPIFDGKTYSVMLRRNDPHPSLGIASASNSVIDQYYIGYDLFVKRAEDSRIVYSATGSMFISGSLNTTFRAGSTIQFGDNWYGITGSFWGSIDEIKLWEIALSEDRFNNHTIYRGAYDSSTPQEMVEKNLLHISFDRPIDLYTGSGVVSLNNLSFRKDFPTFTANNFTPALEVSYDNDGCPYDVPVFPYQFLQKNMRQTVQVPSYGAARFRSNKINKIDQFLGSTLSSENRSSVPLESVNGKDSNKLGVFFSPTDIQNEEILKFFGQFEIGDLIGDPRTVYDRTYKKFEKFREIYFDQGLGIIDYQSFMNLVKSYFDKSMFNYIRAVLPARSKLVEGLVLEPSILERPKIQLKPIFEENVIVPTGSVYNMNYGISGRNPGCQTQSLDIKTSGVAILNDVNHIHFNNYPDEYGFGVYADGGITYYDGEYYRADIITNKKIYQTKRKYALAGYEKNEYEKQVNFEGTVQSISRSYEEVSLASLPLITKFPMYLVAGPSTNISYTGSISFDIGANGYTSSVQTSSHYIDGFMVGTITGIPYDQNPSVVNSGQNGSIIDLLHVSGNFVPQTSGAVIYNGFFDSNYNATEFYFSGSISFVGFPPPASRGYYNINFISQNETGSLIDEFIIKTTGELFGTANNGIAYKKAVSLQNVPVNSQRLSGYFPTHYKYKKRVFSQKEINSYDQQNVSQKWKRGSQNKKTTVDEKTGLLNNTFPVETKAT
jgi:hypothetical protein